jgi:hypothetical protein
VDVGRFGRQSRSHQSDEEEKEKKEGKKFVSPGPLRNKEPCKYIEERESSQ